jgi:general stress protein YciG
MRVLHAFQSGHFLRQFELQQHRSEICSTGICFAFMKILRRCCEIFRSEFSGVVSVIFLSRLLEVSMTTERNDQRPRSNRGFGAMDAARQREIASQGGRAAHAQGKAHEFTSEEARAAGRRSHESGRAHEFTSEEAREAGRKGGESSRNRNAGRTARTGDTGIGQAAADNA